MSRVRVIDYSQTISFPRVSGDEPSAFKAWKTALKFSPRERG